jgi:altronate dehydratase
MLQAIESTIRLHPVDDVVIARAEIPTGTLVTREKVHTVVTIPAGHKLAVQDIAQSAPVRRYNQVIGFATRPIKAGEHVHVHNLAMGDFERDYVFCLEKKETAYIRPSATFLGIVREDGRVGTRNYIGVLTSVNCSASAGSTGANLSWSASTDNVGVSGHIVRRNGDVSEFLCVRRWRLFLGRALSATVLIDGAPRPNPVRLARRW